MSPSVDRRTFLRASGLAIAGLAGCLTDPNRPGLSDPEHRRTTATGTPTEQPTDGTETTDATTEPGIRTTGEPWAHAKPDEDHDITVENYHERAHTVTLTITHDGETVHEESYEAESGADRVVYNFTRSPVDGKAEYEVTARLEGGQFETIHFVTDTCHGEVIVSIDADGKLDVIYSVC